MKVDYLVVGSGLTGAVIARKLADMGKEVLVLDRRSHPGGNVHDHVHPCGIRVHTYGPHYFRTTSPEIWSFVNRFALFFRFEAQLKSLVDGRYENWPIALSYISREIGKTWQPDFRGTPANFEEATLAFMPRLIYEKFVKGYTEKQWGTPAHRLESQLASRFQVHEDDDPRLKRHQYQGIPLHGYASFMNSLLEGIPVILNLDYLKAKHDFQVKRTLVYTGAIDEFFGFDLGRLAYRGQMREHAYYEDLDTMYPSGQINNPGRASGEHIRTLEWKHMMPRAFADRIKGTVITKETPFSPSDPNCYEYPFPDTKNSSLYRLYRNRADSVPGVLICGRLGEYRYYDMDEAIARAMVLADRLVAEADNGSAQSSNVSIAA